MLEISIEPEPLSTKLGVFATFPPMVIEPEPRSVVERSLALRLGIEMRPEPTLEIVMFEADVMPFREMCPPPVEEMLICDALMSEEEMVANVEAMRLRS